MPEDIIFCKSGGCTAKLGAGVLSNILSKLPKGEKDENLIVGYESSDDAAVYKLTEDVAFVQTLDFFPPMVSDPYIFGQIAAANAMSDVYAMGGDVKTALNIVCFPETGDMNVLGRILQGGADKVIEAGGVLAGGHSISDSDIKYGLSVTGVINPNRIFTNNGGKATDYLILTKKLGVGIVMAANKADAAENESFEEAISSMTALNKTASNICRKYKVHAVTDVTGFGFLGHLKEMINDEVSAVIDSISVPVIKGAVRLAKEFYITGAGQKNRSYAEREVSFSSYISEAMKEVLFDPQTSGGLLVAVDSEDAKGLLSELRENKLPAAIVGRLVEKKEKKIYVE